MLNKEKLAEIGLSMHGRNWKKSLAQQLGISMGRMYQLASADEISPRVAERILGVYEDWKQGGGVPFAVTTVPTVTDEEMNMTDEEILGRIQKRFGVMNRMVEGMIRGVIRSMVVSGAPGIGKTYDIEKALERASREQGLNYSIIKGTASAPGLYQALYRARNGGVVVLDDCDSVLSDEQTFNILKSGLDSCDKRVIAWRKQSSWVYDARNEGEDDEVEDLGDRVPNEFEFNGGVIFITNIDFNEKAEQQTKMSPHFQALLSRSMYLDLTLKSMRSRMIRIKDVFLNSMNKVEKLTSEQSREIMGYVVENADRLNELSLRTVKHICQLYKIGSDWKEIVEYTKMRSPRL